MVDARELTREEAESFKRRFSEWAQGLPDDERALVSLILERASQHKGHEGQHATGGQLEATLHDLVARLARSTIVGRADDTDGGPDGGPDGGTPWAQWAIDFGPPPPSNEVE